MAGLLVAWLMMGAQAAASLHGRVIDAQTGSPVARVAVLIDGVKAGETDDRGEFTVPAPTRSRVEIMITAVSYGFVKRTIAGASAGTDLGTIALNRESAALAEIVTVSAASAASAAQHTLGKSELETLSMVLVDDPLRSVHTLPGVVANNDLRAEFSLRGAGFEQIGVYVDGIRTDGFVHLLSDSGTTDQLSLSIVNQDTIASAALTPGVVPAAFGGLTAGVLELDTREGNRERVSVHGSTGFIATTGLVEGPLPRQKGSWLLAGRTTRADYVDQVVSRATRSGPAPDESDLQFDDVHAKGVFDLTARQQIGISMLAGVFTNEQGASSRTEAAADPNFVARARSGNWLRSAHWRYTPGPRVFAQVRLFSVGSTYRESAEDGTSLIDNGRHATGVRADVTFQLSSRHLAQAGAYLQSAQEEAQARFFTDTGQVRQLGAFAARRVETSWYAQDNWSPFGRLTTTVGVRVDRIGGETVVSPRVKAGLALGGGWLVHGAAGMQGQAPPLSALFGLLGNRDLRASHSVEVDAGVEKSLSGRLKLTIDLYQRRDRDQLFALAEPRIENGRVTAAPQPFQNALDGRSRGAEVTIRRDSASRLSGWIGYAYGRTRFTDRLDALEFPGDFDQRHTVNSAVSYRLSGTLALNAEWRYGSGTPRTGFFQMTGGTLELGTERNTIRLPHYQRLDVKVRKAFVWGRSTFTLSAQVLNVLNRQNEYNVTSTIRSLAETGRFVSGLRASFPITPAVSLAIRF